MKTSLQILTKTLGWIKILGRELKSSAESSRCVAGHLKFRYQTRSSNLLMYIDNINFLLSSYFNDQIWWNPLSDIWSTEPRSRICRLFFKSSLKPSARYQDSRPRVLDVRPNIWNSDIRHAVVINQGSLAPVIFVSVFGTRNKLNYNLHHVSQSDVPLINSIYNGTESISFLGPRIYDILPNDMKEMKTVEVFKVAIKNGNRIIAPVNFVSAIWLGSDLSDTYLQSQSLLAGRQFKFYSL